MKQVQFSECPFSIHLVDELQHILGTVPSWVVSLNLGTSVVTPVTSHTHPKPFDEITVYWSGTGQKSMKMASTCWLPASRKPLLITTDISDIASKITFKSVYEFSECLISLRIRYLPGEGERTK